MTWNLAEVITDLIVYSVAECHTIYHDHRRSRFITNNYMYTVGMGIWSFSDLVIHYRSRWFRLQSRGQ